MRALLTSLISTTAAAAAAVALAAGVGTADAAKESIAQDYRSAVLVVSDYWEAKAPELFGIDYVAPKVRGVIDPGDPTACGPMLKMNAIYCRADHSVQFGSDYLQLAHSIGDVIIYDVVAHEWAHAVLRQLPSSLVDDPQELQAECLAGAALGDLAEQRVLVLEDGDVDELADLFEYSDAPGDPHGTTEQQTAAFVTGWKKGPVGCFHRS